MAEGGYRGISISHGDIRFGNKEAKLLKQMAGSGQFPPHFDKKVDMSKVSVEVMRPWVEGKVTELLGFEDDVVIEYAMGLLEDKDDRFPDPRKIQISLTGFLESSTASFVSELWKLLLSAQESVGGIPKEFVERKKEELRLARERDARAIVRGGAAPGGGGGASGTTTASAGESRRRGGSRWDSGGTGGGAGLPQRPSTTGYDGSRDARDDRGGGRGRGQGGGGGGGGGHQRHPPSTFKDKSGNVTERVQDSGWGRRAGGYNDGDRDDGRDRYEAGREEGYRGGGYRRDPYAYDDPYYRPSATERYRDDPYYQPASRAQRDDPYYRSGEDDRRGERGGRGYGRFEEEDGYHYSRRRESRRRSPSPTRSTKRGGSWDRREGSRTPPMRRSGGAAQEVRRERERDDTPPMKRRRRSSRTSRSPPISGASRSLSPTSTSISRSRSRTRSRSITPDSPRRSRRRQREQSRSISPESDMTGRHGRREEDVVREGEEAPARTLLRKKSKWEEGEEEDKHTDAKMAEDEERELRERVRKSQGKRGAR